MYTKGCWFCDGPLSELYSRVIDIDSRTSTFRISILRFWAKKRLVCRLTLISNQFYGCIVLRYVQEGLGKKGKDENPNPGITLQGLEVKILATVLMFL